ncbi:MAG: hypothetical protein ACPGQS_07645 [Bradymonadia bacterium]
MAGINQLGGAQSMVQADTGVRDSQQFNAAGATNLAGTQEAPDDAVQATKEVPAQERTDEDGKAPGDRGRQFFQLAKRSRRPDPLTGDLISLGVDEPFDIARLETPKLSLVSTEEEVSKKTLLERALTNVFSRPASAYVGHKDMRST